jgi:hypothetical protein
MIGAKAKKVLKLFPKYGILSLTDKKPILSGAAKKRRGLAEQKGGEGYGKNVGA